MQLTARFATTITCSLAVHSGSLFFFSRICKLGFAINSKRISAAQRLGFATAHISFLPGRVREGQKEISSYKSRRTQLVQHSKHDLLLASTCLTSSVMPKRTLGPDTRCRTTCVDITDALTSLIIDCISITHKTTRDVFHATHALARLPIAS